MNPQESSSKREHSPDKRHRDFARFVALFVVLPFCLLVLPILAQAPVDPDLPSETTLRIAEPFIVMLAKQYTWLCTVLIGIGTLRLVGKPAVAAWHWYVLQTPSPNDDAFLAKVERSRGWKVFFFLIDWLGSIKLPPRPANEPKP
jgi:hypothetical protein